MDRLLISGGGLAGLLTSAAAAPFYSEVVVVDPRASGGITASAPQADQLHNILTRGQLHLEELLPGFRQRLLAGGAVEGSVADNTHVFEFGGAGVERPLGMVIWSAPWRLLWETARSLLPSNVLFVNESRVEGLVVVGNSVRAATLRRSGRKQTQLDVDGFIDAGGYATSVPRLLSDSGRSVPATTEHRLDRWFVTARLRRPPRWSGTTDFWMVFTEPPSRDVALLSPYRDDEWILSVSSESKQAVPRDVASMCRFLDQLPGPALRPLLESAMPVQTPTLYRRPLARWRHYESQVEPLERFAAIGDSYAAINPAYGQGVGVAAWQAALLRDALSTVGRDGAWARVYLALAGKAIKQAWSLDDLPVPYISVREWARVADAVSRDPDLHRRYVGLWHLVEPPSTLKDLVAAVAPRRQSPEDQ